jgi:hypothetical protein
VFDRDLKTLTAKLTDRMKLSLFVNEALVVVAGDFPTIEVTSVLDRVHSLDISECIDVKTDVETPSSWQLQENQEMHHGIGTIAMPVMLLLFHPTTTRAAPPAPQPLPHRTRLNENQSY